MTYQCSNCGTPLIPLSTEAAVALASRGIVAMKCPKCGLIYRAQPMLYAPDGCAARIVPDDDRKVTLGKRSA